MCRADTLRRRLGSNVASQTAAGETALVSIRESDATSDSDSEDDLRAALEEAAAARREKEAARREREAASEAATMATLNAVGVHPSRGGQVGGREATAPDEAEAAAEAEAADAAAAEDAAEEAPAEAERAAEAVEAAAAVAAAEAVACGGGSSLWTGDDGLVSCRYASATHVGGSGHDAAKENQAALPSPSLLSLSTPAPPHRSRAASRQDATFVASCGGGTLVWGVLDGHGPENGRIASWAGAAALKEYFLGNVAALEEEPEEAMTSAFKAAHDGIGAALRAKYGPGNSAEDGTSSSLESASVEASHPSEGSALPPSLPRTAERRGSGS